MVIAIIPAMAKRRDEIVKGGACSTMMRADVKADDQIRAKVRPMRMARISMSVCPWYLLAAMGDRSIVEWKGMG